MASSASLPWLLQHRPGWRTAHRRLPQVSTFTCPSRSNRPNWLLLLLRWQGEVENHKDTKSTKNSIALNSLCSLCLCGLKFLDLVSYLCSSIFSLQSFPLFDQFEVEVFVSFYHMLGAEVAENHSAAICSKSIS